MSDDFDHITAILNDASRPLALRLADACKRAGSLAEKGSSFALNVSFHEFCEEPTIKVTLHGNWGVIIAKQAGVLPGEWYAFESMYKNTEKGTPQRNYEWEVDGVKFSTIESTHPGGDWTFDTAFADFESRAGEREAAAESTALDGEVPF
jgi:hypothetical protein